MESPINDGPAPREDAVRGAGEARDDALHARRERRTIARLDDQVDVVAKDGVVHDAEGAALARLREGAAELCDEATAAQ